MPSVTTSDPPRAPAPAPASAAVTKAVPVDALFKALADPTRLRIARLLAAMELAVGELAQVLGQSQPRVSRHVGILCDAGLAERRREGSWVFLRGSGGSEEASPIVTALDRALAIAEEQDAAFAAECEDDRRKLAASGDVSKRAAISSAVPLAIVRQSRTLPRNVRAGGFMLSAAAALVVASLKPGSFG